MKDLRRQDHGPPVSSASRAQDSPVGGVVAHIGSILRSLPLLAALFLAAVTLDATAAEPSSGTVSASSPSVSWTGEAETAPFAREMRDERFRRCTPAICDTFALTVGDPGELAVQVKGEEKAVAVQLTLPDASTVFADNFDGDPDQPVRIVVQGAKPGDYRVDMWQDASELDKHQLAGDARLTVTAPVATAPATAATPAPAASPPPPATRSSPRLRLHTARARGGSRRVRIGVSATDAVRAVSAQLTSAGRVVARARLARLDGRATIVLQARRPLRPGRYGLALSATDESGTRIAVSRRVTLTRR